MSLIQSKPRKRWFFAAHSVVSTKLKRQLDRALKEKQRDETLVAKLEWRLAYNWYCGGRYSDAYPILSNICASTTMRKSKGLEITQTLSFKNLVTARCCLFLFYETKDHKYLKQSYNYYQTSIETMEYDLFAMFRLPMILLEFGRVMEHYGSFEPALGLYSRVLANFPNFRGYFIIMYRTAVIGKYIGEMQDKGGREQWLEKCIDILQFLLEALPRGICDVRIIIPLIDIMCRRCTLSCFTACAWNSRPTRPIDFERMVYINLSLISVSDSADQSLTLHMTTSKNGSLNQRRG